MKVLTALGLAVIAAMLAVPAAAQYAAPVTEVSGARADGVRIATMIKVAEIVDINLETREATLRDDQGEEVTIVAPEIVTRLEDYSVGDMLIVEYLSSMAEGGGGRRSAAAEGQVERRPREAHRGGARESLGRDLCGCGELRCDAPSRGFSSAIPVGRYHQGTQSPGPHGRDRRCPGPFPHDQGREA